MAFVYYFGCYCSRRFSAQSPTACTRCVQFRIISFSACFHFCLGLLWSRIFSCVRYLSYHGSWLSVSNWV